MPAVFNRLPGWSLGILTSHARLERLLGHRADSRRKLYNGRIECWFYQFAGQNEPLFHPADERALERYRRHHPLPVGEDRGEGAESASPALPHTSPRPDASSHQLEMFANRLRTRARHLRKWPQRGITCFRLYERDIPEIPLVIDRYEDCLHVVERPRPHDRTLNEHHRWLERVAATAAEALGVEPAAVFLKRYSDRRDLLAETDGASPTHVVHEVGLKYQVNLSDYQDTGLRLDLRLMRGMVGKLSAGKRVLVVYGNTGGFAVAAAAGGAAATLTLDPAGVHVQWTRQNLLLNGFDPQVHEAVCAAAADFSNHISGDLYDLIAIEDPAPDHAGLLDALRERLAPGGVLFLVSHDRRFRLADLATLQLREITPQTVPEDFRNRRIHRAWRIRPLEYANA
jgi:23S rRNA (guanine2445-N2)-methyltransferase / 23S rRNA (guanine2069-N7)-methyltransferase